MGYRNGGTRLRFLIIAEDYLVQILQKIISEVWLFRLILNMIIDK